MYGHKQSESFIDQFSIRLRARHTLEEPNKMKTFGKKNRFEGFSSKTFRKKSFQSFEIQNTSEKNCIDYLTSKILRKKIDLKVMTFAHGQVAP